MSSFGQFLNGLRKKPDSTKNAIAAVFALVPALLVGYAQFYMNAKTEQKMAVKASPEVVEEREGVSAFAAFGKILSEGKAAVGNAVGGLEKIDNVMLKENPVQDNEYVATGTADVVQVKDIEAIDGLDITSETE